MLTKYVILLNYEKCTDEKYNKRIQSLERKGGGKMASYNYMMSADEVAQELNCSKSHAYKLVKAMNKELAAQGYITMAGRIPKAFWAKKMYGYEIAGN